MPQETVNRREMTVGDAQEVWRNITLTQYVAQLDNHTRVSHMITNVCIMCWNISSQFTENIGIKLTWRCLGSDPSHLWTYCLQRDPCKQAWSSYSGRQDRWLHCTLAPHASCILRHKTILLHLSNFFALLRLLTDDLPHWVLSAMKCLANCEYKH